MTKQNFIDDIELDEESLAEVLMDENATASVPRSALLTQDYFLNEQNDLLLN